MGNTKTGPLEGIRVIEMGSLIAGPYAGAVLAQFGAEVIKIEPSNRRSAKKMAQDGWRYLSVVVLTESKQEVAYVESQGPRRARGVRDLVKEADVLVENFRPGTLEKWNLGWDVLSAINSKLVMLRVSGYGQSGPFADKPGFAAIAEAIVLRYLIGYPDRAPVRTGVSIGDTLASLYELLAQ